MAIFLPQFIEWISSIPHLGQTWGEKCWTSMDKSIIGCSQGRIYLGTGSTDIQDGDSIIEPQNFSNNWLALVLTLGIMTAVD